MVLFSPHYKWEDWGAEKSSRLPRPHCWVTEPPGTSRSGPGPLPCRSGEAEDGRSQDVTASFSPFSTLSFHLPPKALSSGDRKLPEKEPDSEWAGEEIRNLHLPIQESVQHALWNWHLATQVKCPDAPGKEKWTLEEVRISRKANME